MSGTDLEELQRPPPTERPEIVDYAIQLMTPNLGGSSDVLPECVEGSEAAERISKQFCLGIRQAKRYVEHARNLIAAEFSADLPARARLLSSISLAVVREAYRDREYAAVNGAVRNLCTIYGLDAKVVIKGDGMSALLEAVRATPGQRDDEIAKLEAKSLEDANGPDPG